MERATTLARPRVMINSRRTHGLGAAGLLCAGLLCTGLAGCGTATASSSPATEGAPSTRAPASGAGGAALATAATPQTGCASVNQATWAIVMRHVLVREPVNGGTKTYTQRHATKVRALFGDFCAALAHADVPQEPIDCPADFGTLYTGTFYDGQRTLATFTYNVGGCPRLQLTASGRTRGTLLLGKAAAAAPHLKADLAAVVGLPQAQVYGTPSQTLSPVK
jgi:hypothetical protein